MDDVIYNSNTNERLISYEAVARLIGVSDYIVKRTSRKLFKGADENYLTSTQFITILEQFTIMGITNALTLLTNIAHSNGGAYLDLVNATDKLI